MSPAEKRLKELKEMLEAELNSDIPSQLYIDDLRLSIKVLELSVERNDGKGYEMVKG